MYSARSTACSVAGDMRHSIYRWLATYAAGAALVAPQLLGAQNTRDQQREAPEVRKLTFSGVKSVDQNDLQKSIATQATKCRSMLLMPFCWISHSPVSYTHLRAHET